MSDTTQATARRSPLPSGLRWLGPPLAGFFCTGVALRRCVYTCGLKRPRRASAPVISVGNLTAGGTGKTPAVACLVRGLKERGRQPAVVLRGYGAPARGALNDEGLELARQFPDVPILANPDRAAGAAEAIRLGADVIVLDDGFQHWALARDFDLVLLDATDPWGGGHRLPWGYLREAPAALTRAQAVLLTRADCVSAEQRAGLRQTIQSIAPQALLGTARHRPCGLYVLRADAPAPAIDALRGRHLFAACGLARPEHFHTALKTLDVELAGTRSFADHQVYTEADLRTCCADARASSAEAIVITEKDASKWARLPASTENLPVWVLQVTFEIADGAEALWQAVERAVARRGSD